MGKLLFELDEIIVIRDKTYQVIGIVEYKNDRNGKTWREYKIRRTKNDKIYWLRIGLRPREYVYFTVVKYEENRLSRESIKSRGYKKYYSFMATVKACNGDVNVGVGYKVVRTEYVHSSGKLIIAAEQLQNEVQYLEGHYLKRYEITDENDTSTSQARYNKWKTKNILYTIAFYSVSLIILIALNTIYNTMIYKKCIYNYLKDGSKYCYETSITSSGAEKEKAQVYISSLSIDETVKDIIDNIDGHTKDVSKNDGDDNSVIILTEHEYCLVYKSIDNEVLVQSSSRLYTYTSNFIPYRCRYETRNFYRGFYYQNVFADDSYKYNSYDSYYATADISEFDTTSSSDDTYNVLASTIRKERARKGKYDSGWGNVDYYFWFIINGDM